MELFARGAVLLPLWPGSEPPPFARTGDLVGLLGFLVLVAQLVAGRVGGRRSSGITHTPQESG